MTEIGFSGEALVGKQDLPRTKSGWVDWNAVLAPHGFKYPSHGLDRTLRDETTLYFVQREDLVKVGITRNMATRMNGLRLGSPRGLYLRGQRGVPSLLARQVEKQTHDALAEFAIGREWFRTTPAVARAAAIPICKRSWDAIHTLNAIGWPKHFDPEGPQMALSEEPCETERAYEMCRVHLGYNRKPWAELTSSEQSFLASLIGVAKRSAQPPLS